MLRNQAGDRSEKEVLEPRIKDRRCRDAAGKIEKRIKKNAYRTRKGERPGLILKICSLKFKERGRQWREIGTRRKRGSS